jgi:hypothetical protein
VVRRSIGIVAARAVLAAILLASPSCTALRSRDPEDRTVTVELSASRAEAVRRTLAAFREQGYRVRESLTSGSEPETEPFRQGDVEAVFRAAISGTGSRARVVLSGTYRGRELGGLLPGGEHEVRRSDDPVERALWARLTNLGLAVRMEGR